MYCFINIYIGFFRVEYWLGRGFVGVEGFGVMVDLGIRVVRRGNLGILGNYRRGSLNYIELIGVFGICFEFWKNKGLFFNFVRTLSDRDNFV